MEIFQPSAKPDLRTALMFGLFLGVFSAVLAGVVVPVGWYFTGSPFPPADLLWSLFRIFLICLVVFAPLAGACAYFLERRKSWTIQADGILIHSWRPDRFIPWSDIKRIDANRFMLTLRLSRWSPATIHYVNGLTLWDFLPPDKRRKVGLIQWPSFRL